MIAKTSQTYHLDIEDITVQPMCIKQYWQYPRNRS